MSLGKCKQTKNDYAKKIFFCSNHSHFTMGLALAKMLRESKSSFIFSSIQSSNKIQATNNINEKKKKFLNNKRYLAKKRKKWGEKDRNISE